MLGSVFLTIGKAIASLVRLALGVFGILVSIARRRALRNLNNTSAQPDRAYGFDLPEQARGALWLLTDLLPRAPEIPYLWKPIVFSMFDAMHAFFGLALRSNGAQLLTPAHERRAYARWEQERQTGIFQPPPSVDRISSTADLYKSVQEPARMEQFTNSKPLQPTEQEDEAFQYLKTLRDKLTHPGASTLVINVAELPAVILDNLSIIDFLLNQSENVTLLPEEEDSLESLVTQVRDAATAIAAQY